METELARAVDVVMACTKRIYILITIVNKLFSLFLSQCLLKEKETCTPCFYRVIQTLVKAWENSQKMWKRSPGARVPTAFLVLPKTSTHVSIHQLDYELEISESTIARQRFLV